MNARRIIAVVLVAVVGLGLSAWGAIAGTKDVMGVVVKKGAASIETMEQVNPKGEVTIASVKAPADAFVIVHLAKPNGMPGERLGYTRVTKGTHKDVVVKIKDVELPATLIAAVHIDRGTKGKLEFDMDNKEHSPDKPFFVDGMEAAMPFKVGRFGVEAADGAAAIEVADQTGVTDTLTVKRAVAPTAAWVVVHLDDNGRPGKRVGLQQIPAGENTNVKVALDPNIPLTDKLLVAVHADRGTAGQFDFDMMKKLESADQPFFVNGAEVATAAQVR